MGRLIGFGGWLRSGFVGFCRYNNNQIENQPNNKSPQQKTHHKNHQKKKNQQNTTTKNQQIHQYWIESTKLMVVPQQNRRGLAKILQGLAKIRRDLAKIRRDLSRSNENSPDLARSHQIRRDLARSCEISPNSVRSNLIWNLSVAVEIWQWNSTRSPFVGCEIEKKMREGEGD